MRQLARFFQPGPWCAAIAAIGLVLLTSRSVVAQPPDRLGPNEALHPNERLLSPNGRYDLVYQGDGNLVLSVEGSVIWATYAHYLGELVMQSEDGNLVLYEGGQPKWQSFTSDPSHNANSSLILTNGGALEIRRSDDSLVTTLSHGGQEPPAGRIGRGGWIDPGEERVSPAGYRLRNQADDGNLVLYTNDYQALWSTGPGSPGRAAMQEDGNFVLHGANGQPRWDSETNGADGARLEILNGRLAIFDRDGNEIWTVGESSPPEPSFFRMSVNGKSEGQEAAIRVHQPVHIDIEGRPPFPDGWVVIKRLAGGYRGTVPLNGNANQQIQFDLPNPPQLGKYETYVVFGSDDENDPYFYGPNVEIVWPGLRVNGVTNPPPVQAPGRLDVEVINNPGGDAADWVGLFLREASDEATPVARKYLNDSTVAPPEAVANGTVRFDVPNTPGLYDVRFFASNWPVALAVSAEITVLRPNATLSIRGEAPNVPVIKHRGESFWVDVAYAQSGDYLLFSNEQGTDARTYPLQVSQTGLAEVQVPTTVRFSARYHVYLIGPDGAILKQSQPIDLQMPMLSVIDTKNGSVHKYEGGGVELTPNQEFTAWYAGVHPTSGTGDWVGLFRRGAAATEHGNRWWYLNCQKQRPAARSADGSLPPSGSSCTPPLKVPDEEGTFELRLYANDGYDDLLSIGPGLFVKADTPVLTINGVGAGLEVKPTISPIVVNVKYGTPHPASYVALFNADAPDHDYQQLKFVATNQSSPTPVTIKTENDLTFNKPVAEGDYEVRYFDAEVGEEGQIIGFTRRAVGPRIIIESTAKATITINGDRTGPVRVNANTPLTIVVEGEALLPGDLLEIQKPNAANAEDVEPLGSSTSPVTITSMSAPSASGSYEVRLMRYGGSPYVGKPLGTGPTLQVNGFRGNDVISYYSTDAIGSVRLVTNQSGVVTSTRHYYPFGTDWLVNGTTDDRIRFAGKERDAESSLSYFGARYFADQMGRFTSVDPLLDIERTLGDAQRWNRYSYANNNPLRFVDPDGRAAETLWDLISIGMGLSSFAGNVKEGAYGAAALDLGGVAIDSLSAAVPFVPAFGSSAIRAMRFAENVANGTKFERAVIDAIDAVKNTKGVSSVALRKTAIPDLYGELNILGGIAGITDVKNVTELNFSKQLQVLRDAASTGKVPFNLIISNKTKTVSKPLYFSISQSGGRIIRFDDELGVFVDVTEAFGK